MARDRHRSKKNTTKATKPAAVSLADLVKRDVATRIEKARAARDAREKIPKHIERAVPDKSTRRTLARHGFRTTGKGVVIDGPRNRKREPIKGARVKVMSHGTVKTSVGQRRDFIYGFTAKEKREFAKDPGGFQKKKLTELERIFPSLRAARKKQVRLQWGAYQATKDFTPTYFSAKYFASISNEEIRKVGKKHATPRLDKLTGLHIVIHVPKKKGKRAKGGKKK